MNNYRIKKFAKFIGFIIVMGLIAGSVVTLLWNALLPAILGVSKITILQGLGILVLSRILFGGFPRPWKGGGHKRHQSWRKKMRQKWENMTPEERAKFKEKFPWKHRGPWKNDDEEGDTPPETA